MKEKLIMWGAVIGLAILLFFIPTKAHSLTKDEIKDHVYNPILLILNKLAKIHKHTSSLCLEKEKGYSVC